MCIMFVYINNNPSSEDYQLILVNNRDEFYERPTKPAMFWDHCSYCIGGLDLTAGRENGTWLGVSKHGKIGSLLNILTPYDPLPSKRGRGHLVTDFLQGSDSAQSYLEAISENGAHFNAFGLALLEKEEPGDWSLLYYSNSDASDNKVKKYADGIYGISNSVLDQPFQKVTYGKQHFEDVVKKCGRPAYREQLLHDLTNMMSDKMNFEDDRMKQQSGTRFQQSKLEELSKIFVSLPTYGTKCLPDAQLFEQAEGYLSEELREQRSCIYVDSSQISYGTRTTTVFLVDHQNNCEYVERTMQEPIDAKNPKWVTMSHTFSLSHPSAAKI